MRITYREQEDFKIEVIRLIKQYEHEKLNLRAWDYKVKDTLIKIYPDNIVYIIFVQEEGKEMSSFNCTNELNVLGRFKHFLKEKVEEYEKI